MSWFDDLETLFSSADNRPAAEPWYMVPFEEHPFPFDLLDQRRFSLGVRSSTQDPSLTERFAALRDDDGRSSLRTPPQQAALQQVELIYPLAEAFGEGCLFRAQIMEEKWDIFHYGRVILFRRSWSGEVIFRAQLRRDGARLILSQLESHHTWDPKMAVRVVDFLVWSHVFGRPCPHPVPEGMLAAPAKAATWSFSTFGRLAWFAAEGDPGPYLRKAP